MSSGFNTDIKVGEQVFHVQTEDRGPSHPAIDTLVYQSGRILHRKSSNYEDFAGSPSFTPELLHQRVQDQHRAVIEALRSGALDAEIVAATEASNPAARPAGIQIQLLNPGSWLSAGKVSLELEVSRRTDRRPGGRHHRRRIARRHPFHPKRRTGTRANSVSAAAAGQGRSGAGDSSQSRRPQRRNSFFNAHPPKTRRSGSHQTAIG